MKFYLAREGVAFGPYTEFQVSESIRLGIFERSDLALAEDGREWSTVAQLLPAAGNEKVGPVPSKPAAKSVEPGGLAEVPTPKIVPATPESPSVEATASSVTAPAILELPSLKAATFSRPNRRLTWQTALVALVLFIAGGRIFLPVHPADTRRSLPKRSTVAEHVVSVVRPEPTLRPPTDDMTLPTRENLPPVLPEASTVANPQVPPTEIAQKVVPDEEMPKAVTPEHVIEGQINIAARNGRNYEPTAVEVRLYSVTLLKPYLEKRGQEASARYDEIGEKMKAAEAEKESLRKISDAAFEAYTAADRDALNLHELEVASEEAKKAREKSANDYYNMHQEREGLLSGAFYLADLPPAASVTRTDSQGKFRLTTSEDGEYVVVAGTQRGDDGAERYYWFVPVSLTGEPNKTLLLSNNNTTARGSAESLVQTID